MKRTVLTGIGSISPLGSSFEDSWEGLIAGKSGISEIEVPGLGRTFAGTVAKPSAYSAEANILDPFAIYALSAGKSAIADSGLDELSLRNAPVIIGSSRGGISSIEAGVQRLAESKRVSPFLMPSTTIGIAASHLAMKIGATGSGAYSLGISNSCPSGANAIGEAFKTIRRGEAIVAVAGGAEAPLCNLSFAGYGIMGALSKTGVPRPFDKDREGFVLAEGSTVLVLEELGHAIKRNARIYAEVVGYGASVDGYHQSLPLPEGQCRAMLSALEAAGLSADEIDYLNAHATGTKAGDSAEALAIASVFGGREIAVSASKSMTGHMLSASGAFEIASTAMSIYSGIIPPTINASNQDGKQMLNLITVKTEADIRSAMSNSFGFGGVNAVIVLKRFEE